MSAVAIEWFFGGRRGGGAAAAGLSGWLGWASSSSASSSSVFASATLGLAVFGALATVTVVLLTRCSTVGADSRPATGGASFSAVVLAWGCGWASCVCLDLEFALLRLVVALRLFRVVRSRRRHAARWASILKKTG